MTLAFDLHIDQKAIEDAYAELTQGLTDEDKDRLGKATAKMSILVKAPDRVRAICADIAKHYEEKVAPNGFGAQIVTFDRESCLLYKQELDLLDVPPLLAAVRPAMLLSLSRKKIVLFGWSRRHVTLRLFDRRLK